MYILCMKEQGNRSMRLLWVLVFVALGFLFQCGKSDDSSKDVDPPPTNVKLSASVVSYLIKVSICDE